MNPTHRDLAHDPLLTNMSIAYMLKMQAPFSWLAGSGIVPDLRVDAETFDFRTWNKGDFFRLEVAPRGRYAEAAVAGIDASETEAKVVREALATPIARVDLKNDPLAEVERKKVQWLTMQHLLKRDKNVSDVMFQASTWTGMTDQAGVDSGSPGANQFSRWDRSDSTPIEDVQGWMHTLHLSIGIMPNTLALGPEVWRYLRTHADLTDLYKHTRGGALTTELVAQALGVERVVVPGAIYNAAAKGATDSMTRIVGKLAWLGYLAPAPARDEPSAMYNFFWPEFDMVRNGGVAMKRIDEPKKDGWLIEGEMYHKAVITAADAGMYASAVVN